MLLPKHAPEYACIMENKKLEAFWNWVKKQLSVKQFEELQQELGATTPYKWTSLQTGSRDFKPEQLDTLSKILKISKSDLIQKYGLGMENLTGKQLMAIAQNDGRKLVFLNG